MSVGKIGDRVIRMALVAALAAVCTGCATPRVSAETGKSRPPPVHTEVDGGNYRKMPFVCDGVTQVLRLWFSTPTWPTSAPKGVVSETVMIRFVVNADGKPEELSVVDASNPIFIEAALAAVRRSQFDVDATLAPCVVGKPLQLPVRFQTR